MLIPSANEDVYKRQLKILPVFFCQCRIDHDLKRFFPVPQRADHFHRTVQKFVFGHFRAVIELCVAVDGQFQGKRFGRAVAVSRFGQNNKFPQQCYRRKQPKKEKHNAQPDQPAGKPGTQNKVQHQQDVYKRQSMYSCTVFTRIMGMPWT